MYTKTVSAIKLISFDRVKHLFPGILISITIAMAAQFLAKNYQAPVMLFALLLGISFNFIMESDKCRAGVEFSAKKLLRIGIVLLGIRITLEDIMSLGYAPIAMVVIGVLCTMIFGIVIARVAGLKTEFGLLSGGSVAICGASAALAISSIFPDNEENKRLTIFTVISVTALSTLAMIVYPLITQALHYNDIQSGVFLGGTIHDVAQVVGAGYSISDNVGDLSTFVKLLRVATLVPVIVILSLYMLPRNSSSQGADIKSIFPLFLLGFVIVLTANSLGFIPKSLQEFMTTLSSWLLVIAISALGVKTSLKEVFSLGWAPITMVLMETIFLAGLFIAGIYFLDIQ
ncbi:putative sulfate exporter family transporter [Dasania marina]|uniref:YeiH family protein n=1 Tax=Dasania marina TaxID=471499 RepID=UPI0030D78001|tara:strand:- start:52545 stop:53576 length:1032 start_codon:yes stop_codon:yes gene_type:complete